MPDWMVPLLPLLGVVLGYLGASSQDAKRWRRDWMTSMVTARRDDYRGLLEALYAQHLVLQRLASGEAVDRDRIATVTTAWRLQYARTLISMPRDVQLAIGAYDQARGQVVDAINATSPAVAETLERLDRERLLLIDRINEDLNAINSALGQHLLSPWQRLRGTPPLADIDRPVQGGT